MPGEEIIYLELGDRRLALSPGERTVGRSHRCDLVVDERSVSRVHAMISWSGGRLSVQDLNSSNGTYINGELLRGEADLCDGDEVLLGEAKLRVRRIPSTQSEPIPVEELTAAVDERFTEHRAGTPAVRRLPDLTRSEALTGSEVMATGTPRITEVPVSEPDSEMKTGIFPLAEPAGVQPDTRGFEAAGDSPDAVLDSGSSGELLSPIDFGETLEGEIPATVHTPMPAYSPAPSPAVPPGAEPLSRLVAGLLDVVLLIALTLVVSYFRGGLVTAAGRSLALGFAIIFGTVGLVVSWVVWGSTPGQRMVGLKVCDAEGTSPLSLSRALRRLVGFTVSVVTLGLGFVSLLLHRDRLALHDVISGTRVIRKL